MLTGALVLLFLCGWAAAAPRPPARITTLATRNEVICPGDKATLMIRPPSTGIVGLNVHLRNKLTKVTAEANLATKTFDIKASNGFEMGMPIDLSPEKKVHLQLQFLDQGVRLMANGGVVRTHIFNNPMPCISAAMHLYSIGTDVDMREGALLQYLKA